MILGDQLYVRNENVGGFWLKQLQNVTYASHLHGNTE